ncbi:MAG: helix-turn-helix transcriptional regulator [Actinomycetota bacterium]
MRPASTSTSGGPPFGDPVDFAAALDELLNAAGVPLRELARRVGTSASTLSGWRTGRHVPYPRQRAVLELLLTELGVDDVDSWLNDLDRVRSAAATTATATAAAAAATTGPAADRAAPPGEGEPASARSPSSGVEEVTGTDAAEQSDDDGSIAVGEQPSSRWLRPVTGAGPGRRIGRLLVAAVALGIVLALGFGLLDGEDDPIAGEAAAPSTVDGCPYEAGVVAESGGLDANILAEYEAGGGRQAYGCGLTSVQRLPKSPLTYQEFGRPGATPDDVIVAFDDGGALTLPFAAWGSYRQIGGKSGDNAHAIAGDPVGLRVTGSVAYLELDSEVQLVAEKMLAPYFFVVAPVGEAWEREGGPAGDMGLPTSNLHVRDGRWRQEFETGWLEAENFDGSITWIAADSAADLPPDDVIAGRILGQLDATAWFITADLERKWIPDGLVWECLGGAAEAVALDVPGHAVAQLPYIGLATCADSRVGPMDLAAYCAEQHGPGAAAVVVDDSADWACRDGTGLDEMIDLTAVCAAQYPDRRVVVTLEPGSPTAWKCAEPTWRPLEGG